MKLNNFSIIIAIAAALVLPALAEAQIESLSGSLVVFDPTAGGDTQYIPGASGTFCFRVETDTTDWEYAYNVWMRFPSDWTVTDVVLDDAPAPICDSGSFGTFTWSFHTSPYEINIDHPRYHSSTDHCIAYYCVTATPPASATGTGQVSWYFAGDGYGSTPHWPCSNDNYTPSGEDPCDEAVELPGAVPVPVELSSFQIE